MCCVQHHGTSSMSYFAKVVARVVVLFVGLNPLIASGPCSQAASTAKCCGPRCPMKAMAHMEEMQSGAEVKTGAPPCCKISFPTHSSKAILGTTEQSPTLQGSSDIVVDQYPALTGARTGNATLRVERILHRPRASLCIFLI